MSATDTAGNVSTQAFAVSLSPEPSDAQDPVLSFNPAALTVTSEATGNSALSASDNVGITSGPTVTCTNGGSFADGVFTAPAVSINTTRVCTALAQDAEGNEGAASLTVTIIAPPDTVNPVVNFNPPTLTMESVQTGTSVLSATDNVAVASLSEVSCTNGGRYEGGVFTAPVTLTPITSICTATASDAAGNTADGTLTVSVTGPVVQSIIGTATYDFVPHQATSSNVFRVFPTALNYDAIEQRPIRGATAELVNASNAVLESTTTDSEGAYSFEVDPNSNVRVRIRAEMVQSAGAEWDVRVQDNTNGDGLYVLQGVVQSSGTESAVRDLNAESGWGGSSYTGPRQAAPFATVSYTHLTLPTNREV